MPFPFGPEIGMARSASPAAPLTFVFPETKNPSLIGEPRASITAGCILALAKASLYGSVDLIALKTIMTIEPTKATRRIKIVRQPVGTNHFQFRVHQLPLASGPVGVVGSIGFS